MRKQSKAALVAALIVVLAVGGIVLTSQLRADNGPAAAELEAAIADGAVVRDDSRVLGEAGSSDVIFVEFLDFECEACGAAYPIVEDLREQYAGEITFVIRYFPLPGHFNAGRAARAVESAARQGELEAMYNRMYETQREWGEAQEPKDDLFRSFAEDLGLDMEQYDADYASQEVDERISRDVADGESLGIQGTPTFFINGERFEPRSVEDFTKALDEALAE